MTFLLKASSLSRVKEKLQTTIQENFADVASINDLIRIKNSKVKTLKKQSQYDVVTFYNHNISIGHYRPYSGVQMDECATK